MVAKKGVLWKLPLAFLLVTAALGSRGVDAAISCAATTYTTSTVTGYGTSCTNAQSSVTSTTLTQANTSCQNLGYDRSCSGTVTYTTSCTFNSSLGKYQISGYRTYRCGYIIETCNPICP